MDGTAPQAREIRRLRSLLFMPATRPDLVAKAPRFAPDAVAIDLEDGTAPAEKVQARDLAVQAARDLARQAPRVAVLIRVNSPGSPLMADDLVAAVQAGVAGVVVPKLQAIEELGEVTERLRGAESRFGSVDTTRVLVGIETVLGVHRANELLSGDPRVFATYFGAEDFAADLGAERTAEGTEVLYARSRVVMAARMAGVLALDQAVVELRDEGRFVADGERGRQLGYTGKLCIHPDQVALSHRLFTPSDADVERSRRLLSAYEAGVGEGRAVVEFEGQMVDGPLVLRARAVLAAADPS